jgi:hypothetical protein
MAIGGSRTLKLTILGDVDNLRKSLNQADDDVKKSSSGLGDFSKKAGLAFAAAAAAVAVYAGKLLIDGVKAAIADEAAQDKLAKTLENVTGATNAQIAATEAYITKTSLANGITDDVLRPSLDRLVRSTKNVTEAQQLQQLALDISAGTGKELSVVSEALAKAHDGNFTALKKLGGGIDESILKTKDFDAATAALAKTFEGQATTQTETFEGKLKRLNVAFDEAKETIGSYILQAITPLLTWFVDKGVPAIQKFADAIGKTLGPVFKEFWKFFEENLLPILMKWYEFLFEEVYPFLVSIITPAVEALKKAFNRIKEAIAENSDELQPFYNVMKQIWEFIKKYIGPAMGDYLVAVITALGYAIVGLIEYFVTWANIIEKVYKGLEKIIKFMGTNPILKNLLGPLGTAIFNNQAGNAFNESFDYGGGRAVGGPVMGGTSYIVGERGPELFTPSGSGRITPNNGMGGTTINITVNGAIDREGTARSIIDVLNNSFYRGTGGANNLQFT